MVIYGTVTRLGEYVEVELASPPERATVDRVWIEGHQTEKVDGKA